MPPPRSGSRSLRDRFLLIVLFAAVLPLSAIGLWLTSAAARAGEELRRGQLHDVLEQLERTVQDRWTFRHADLLWLAENELVRQELIAEPGAAEVPAEVTAMFEEVGPGIASVRYFDTAERLRWELLRAGPFEPDPRRRPRATGPAADFAVRLPIVDYDTGRPIGTVEAQVRLSSLLPVDTLAAAVQGVALAVLDSSGAPLLVPDSLPAGGIGDGSFVVGDQAWLAETRAVEALPLRLAAAAPLAPFAAPFERAARTGALALLLVCVVALAMTAVLTTRLTRSLRRLATAADAVAAGDLEWHVEAGGPDEVGRVGAAFNAMTESLRRTLEQLARQQALAAVGRFAASLSHEIRNAHTSVRLDLQRARRKIPEDSPARELVERALGQVERLDRTVTGSLRVARGGRIATAAIDAREPIRLATDAARAEADARGIDLEVRIPADPVPLRGDAGALEHLFLNLLLNAIEASAAGSTVRVDVEREESRATVVVLDEGAGLLATELERVFEPFYSTKATGTGLGLAIARSIAEAHGGSVVLEAREGGGAVASVSLPLALFAAAES